MLGALFASGGNPNHRRVTRVSRLPVHQVLARGLDDLLARGHAQISDGDLLVVSPARATHLGAVLQVFLADDANSPKTKQNLRSAVRAAFDLPAHCQTQDLLDAAASVSLAEDAFAWPDNLFGKITADGGGHNMARNARSWARGLLEYAARHGFGFGIPQDWVRGDVDAVADKVSAALAELWLTDDAPVLADLLRRTDASDTAVRRVVQSWSDEGVLEVVHHGKHVRLLRYSPMQATGTTLATVLVALQDGSLGHAGLIEKTRAGLRRYLDVKSRRPGALALRAAEVPSTDLRRLLSHLREELEHRGVGTESSAQYERAIRRVFQSAAARGLIPMDWSAGSRNVWDDLRWEWFPPGPGRVGGLTKGVRDRSRTAIYWLREALAALGFDGNPGTDLTVTMIEDASRWLMRRGRYDHASQVMQCLKRAGQAGHGPFSESAAAPSPKCLLDGPELQVGTYEELLELFRHHKLPQEWIEFAEFVRDWSTLPRHEINRRNWPERPRSRRLKSVAGRAKGFRLLLGVLHHQHKVDLSTLSLDEAFGFASVRSVFATVEEIWQGRADLSSPHGSAIQLYFVNVGLLAETLYRLRAWERNRREIARPPKGGGRAGVDAVAEEGAWQTPVERSLWQAYRHSREVTDNLKEEATNNGSGSEGSKNTEKDLGRIIEATSADWHLRVHERLLQEARRSIQAQEQGADHHALVALAFLNGVLLSTVCRGNELQHLRIDVHLTEDWWSAIDQDLYIKVRAVDRKNGAHRVRVRASLVPAWLRLAYLNSTRPHYMSDLTVTEKEDGFARAEHHQHLFVNFQGKAFGAWEENADGSGRPDEKELGKRLSGLRAFWQNHLGRFAWEACGLECPDFPWGFGLHSVRNTVAHSVFQALGLEATMNLLGDGSTAIQRHYARLDTFTPPLERVRAIYGPVDGSTSTARGASDR